MLTADERKQFEDAIKEIGGFGEDEGVKALVKEVEDLYKTGSVAAQKEWLKKNLADLTPEENKKWAAYLKKIEDPKARKAEEEAWEASSNVGKRYYLRYVSGSGEVSAPAPAGVIAGLPEDALPLPSQRRRSPRRRAPAR